MATFREIREQQLTNANATMILIINFGLGRSEIPVNSLAEARTAFEAIRNAGDYGARDMRSECGTVKEGARVVARISYNARLWDAAGNPLTN